MKRTIGGISRKNLGTIFETISEIRIAINGEDNMKEYLEEFSSGLP